MVENDLDVCYKYGGSSQIKEIFLLDRSKVKFKYKSKIINPYFYFKLKSLNFI